MTDTASGTGAQGAEGASGQSDQGTQGAPGGAPGTQGAPAGGQAQGAGTEGQQGTPPVERTPEEWAAELDRRERENAQYRERLRTLEAAEEQRRQAGMTEQERQANVTATLERERDEARLELVTARLESAAASAASTLGFRSPALAARLLTAAQRAECVADNGTVDERKLAAALSAELKAHPELGGGTAGADGGQGRRQQGGTSMSELIRQGARGEPRR
jgi:hypothetical protein